ncbi:FkbM family methyltransferase [Candidatus Pelagibacter sp.]|nr:FkbM family methyltransferase [Candidatus Pelagibacter sp.]|tara:strand:- start:674 stop:1450 length:777 start_codon:yes stop_codon:yes gene_type:complete
MKKFIKSFFAIFNIDIRSKSKLEKKLANSITLARWKHDIEFTLQIGSQIGPDFLRLIKLSKSQIRQDLFVLKELKLKKNGFFVEFGATDGVSLSNTYLLEKEFGYKGILAEPNPRQRKNIALERKAKIVNECVWSKSGERLKFVDDGDLSTISGIKKSNKWKNLIKNKSTFFVNTITLTDMLFKYNAPPLIDYLSIDTEGSEFDILSKHDFSKFNFSVITVEHNFTEQRNKIYKLLTANGYNRKYENLSMQDDWYTLS